MKLFLLNSLIGVTIFWGVFFITTSILGATFGVSILFLFISVFALGIYLKWVAKEKSPAVSRAFLFGIWLYPPIIGYLIMARNGTPAFNFNLIFMFLPPGFLVTSFMVGTGPGLLASSVYLIVEILLPRDT